MDFIIIGDGSLRHYIETVKEKTNKNIKILGQVSPEFIPDILSTASVLVLPSYMEGLPTVCLEALACGVPVVASNVGGMPEIIRDGETVIYFQWETLAFALKESSDFYLTTNFGNLWGKKDLG